MCILILRVSWLQEKRQKTNDLRVITQKSVLYLFANEIEDKDKAEAPSKDSLSAQNRISDGKLPSELRT